MVAPTTDAPPPAPHAPHLRARSRVLPPIEHARGVKRRAETRAQSPTLRSAAGFAAGLSRDNRLPTTSRRPSGMRRGESASLQQSALSQLARTHAAQACADAVDLMYSSAGSSALYATSRIA